MKKLFLLLLLLSPTAQATWDNTTPTGTEAKSLGDDRIREMKLDLYNALRAKGNDFFPGTDTANPRFLSTISTFTISNRPTGNSAPAGLIIINISSMTFEQADGSGGWTAIQISTNGILDSSITTAKLSSGAVTTEDILNETIRSEDIFDGAIAGADISSGAVTTVHIAEGTIGTGDIADLAVTNAKLANGAISDDKYSPFTKWSAGGQSASNVTGDGTTYVLKFSSIAIDTAGGFAGDASNSTYTIPTTGFYVWGVNVRLGGLASLDNDSVESVYLNINGSETYDTTSDCDTGDTNAPYYSFTSAVSEVAEITRVCAGLYAAGDTLIPVVIAAGGTKVTTVRSGIFWGYKVP